MKKNPKKVQDPRQKFELPYKIPSPKIVISQTEMGVVSTLHREIPIPSKAPDDRIFPVTLATSMDAKNALNNMPW